MIWFGLVLGHINHCRLFNAKFSLYIYTKYTSFSLVGFYGISTIVGYLMPNSLYTYIQNIYLLVWLGFMAYQPLSRWAVYLKKQFFLVSFSHAETVLKFFMKLKFLV